MNNVSVPPWQYCPGCNNKKTEIQDRSSMDRCRYVTPWDVVLRQWMMEIDIGKNGEGAGSFSA